MVLMLLYRVVSEVNKVKLMSIQFSENWEWMVV